MILDQAHFSKKQSQGSYLGPGNCWQSQGASGMIIETVMNFEPLFA
jgi:hypothetical protein